MQSCVALLRDHYVGSTKSASLKREEKGAVRIDRQTESKRETEPASTTMADADYDRAMVADEAGGGEIDELLLLLEQKDSDLRRAAELGERFEICLCAPARTSVQRDDEHTHTEEARGET